MHDDKTGGGVWEGYKNDDVIYEQALKWYTWLYMWLTGLNFIPLILYNYQNSYTCINVDSSMTLNLRCSKKLVNSTFFSSSSVVEL